MPKVLDTQPAAVAGQVPAAAAHCIQHHRRSGGAAEGAVGLRLELIRKVGEVDLRNGARKPCDSLVRGKRDELLLAGRPGAIACVCLGKERGSEQEREAETS
jgi:hypothetical protein